MHLRNENNRHDFVTASVVGEHVSVKFMWKGLAHTPVQVTGDFTGWKPVTMVHTDPYLGKNYHKQDLTAGKYWYLFIVDGVEQVRVEVRARDLM
jgi:hypothetical protein